MTPPTALNQSATRTFPQRKHHRRRPIYRVILRHDRKPQRERRQFSQLNRPLRVLVTFFVTGCLLWAALVGTLFLLFASLFAKVAGTLLPAVLARLP